MFVTGFIIYNPLRDGDQRVCTTWCSHHFTPTVGRTPAANSYISKHIPFFLAAFSQTSQLLIAEFLEPSNRTHKIHGTNGTSAYMNTVVDLYAFHVGEYTVFSMDPSWDSTTYKTQVRTKSLYYTYIYIFIISKYIYILYILYISTNQGFLNYHYHPFTTTGFNFLREKRQPGHCLDWVDWRSPDAPPPERS